MMVRSILTLVALFAIASPSYAATSVLVAGGRTSGIIVNNKVGQNQIRFLSSAPLETINGSADGISGSFTVNLSDLEATNGNIKVRVESMKTGIDKRDRHMRAKEWLDADRFPEIVFAVKNLKDVKVSQNSKERAVISATAIGEFTLHGVTQKIQVPITLTYIAESDATKKRASGDFVSIDAKFSVALKDFEVRGAQNIVGTKVGEKIEIEAKLFGSTLG